ncbi:MAG TPA: site-2 protease family protein [Solirubrobacteraceae bacterium]|nr:site-2 protease family protein [Solirubrobacteraceae bacterium]
MFGGGSIQLVRLFGIRIGVNPSWFIVLFLLIYLLSERFRVQLGGSEVQAYTVAVISALLFFVSLVLHELGHAVVAKRNGIGISGIDLWLLGGLAKMTRDTQTPGEEFRVAAAGPAVTLLVALACAGASVLAAGSGDVLALMTLQEAGSASPLPALLAFLATFNVLLFVFNMLPAFPLDGGRLAKALVWRITGDRIKATRASAWTGQGFGWLLVGLGVYLGLATGDLLNAVWLGILGFFITQGARSAMLSTTFSQSLDGVTVADIMDAEPVTMPGATSAIDARETFFLRYGWDFFPTVDEAGRFLGLARQAEVDQEVEAGRPATPVSGLLHGDVELWRVRADTPVEQLLGREGLSHQGALMAVDPDGVLRGVVTVEQVRRAVAAALPSRGG